VAVLGTAGTLLKARVAKSLHDRISRKRAQVQEASHLAEPPVGDLLKVRAAAIISVDSSCL